MALLIRDNYMYLLADKEFCEPLSCYAVDQDDFAEPVRRILPDEWRLNRQGFWFYCRPPEAVLSAQGWKIHISSTLANSGAILTTVARILGPRRVTFKFVVDKSLLFLSNGKRWHRGGSGKFITIYPRDTEQCGELLETLRKTLIGYKGPYILSDRRYRDSRVVYYRYGGIQRTKRLDVTGESVSVIQGPDGTYIDDERSPSFRLPSGVTDPFCEEEDGAGQGEAGTLKDGRYKIESAVAFSNGGGVYMAKDRKNGKQVIVKEARPYTNVTPRGTDAVWMLKKEHRLLTILQETGIAPEPIDFFSDWEHFYLVEEFLQGRVLRSYNTSSTPCLRTRVTRESLHDFYGRYRELYGRLAELLQILHGHGIVFSDMSHYNVIVINNDPKDLRLIDFEGAYEEGIDVPTYLFTPGFAPVEMIKEGLAKREDDLYGLGSLMLAGLFSMNNLRTPDPQAHLRYLEAMRHDIGLPEPIERTIVGLLQEKRSERPKIEQVIEVLRSEHPVEPPRTTNFKNYEDDLPNLVSEMTQYILAMTDYERSDRLFPADPMVFTTNPLSVAHGACGVLYALKELHGSVPQEALEWIFKQEPSADTYPPGLYIGLAGIAWTLLEVGLQKRAEQLLRSTQGHYLLWRSPDLFYGAAGWGMAQLRFFLASEDEEYLDAAREVGRFLLESSQDEERGSYWTSQGDICCGLGHGAAGIALYLLYLYLATGERQFLATGRKALSFVADKAFQLPEIGISWRAKENERSPYTPYWRWGSSGIGRVLLRYLQVTGDECYRRLLDDLLPDTNRKYTIFPGRFFGLSGVGDFYLDYHALGGDPQKARQGLQTTLSGTLMFQVERPEGIAFPGDNLNRISCDFGTGSAGIALFLHRCLNRGKADFMLDELLESQQRRVSLEAAL